MSEEHRINQPNGSSIVGFPSAGEVCKSTRIPPCPGEGWRLIPGTGMYVYDELTDFPAPRPAE